MYVCKGRGETGIRGMGDRDGVGEEKCAVNPKQIKAQTVSHRG